MSTTPPKPPAPKAAGPRPSARSLVPPAVPFNFQDGVIEGGDRIIIYGTGGIGKSTLAAWLPKPVILDLERSTKKLPVRRDMVGSWMELRGKLRTFAENPPAGARSVVVDTLTIAEEMAKEYVVQEIPHEKGHAVSSIEGYGYNKGWSHVYDEMAALLCDLDKISDQGFYSCIIAHDVLGEAPSTDEPYSRWEPLLYRGDRNGKSNVRALVKNWAEHMLFVGYDVFVSTEGKATGSGTRTIYTQELPTHVAKSRTAELQLPFTKEDPGAIWKQLGIN